MRYLSVDLLHVHKRPMQWPLVAIAVASLTCSVTALGPPPMQVVGGGGTTFASACGPIQSCEQCPSSGFCDEQGLLCCLQGQGQVFWIPSYFAASASTGSGPVFASVSLDASLEFGSVVTTLMVSGFAKAQKPEGTMGSASSTANCGFEFEVLEPSYFLIGRRGDVGTVAFPPESWRGTIVGPGVYSIGSGSLGASIGGDQSMYQESELCWVRISPAPIEPSDLNGDGSVGAADLAVLLGDWGPGLSIADIDADGIIGATDLAILLGSWSDF
jgi:hypothetical protein